MVLVNATELTITKATRAAESVSASVLSISLLSISPLNPVSSQLSLSLNFRTLQGELKTRTLQSTHFRSGLSLQPGHQSVLNFLPLQNILLRLFVNGALMKRLPQGVCLSRYKTSYFNCLWMVLLWNVYPRECVYPATKHLTLTVCERCSYETSTPNVVIPLQHIIIKTVCERCSYETST